MLRRSTPLDYTSRHKRGRTKPQTESAYHLSTANAANTHVLRYSPCIWYRGQECHSDCCASIWVLTHCFIGASRQFLKHRLCFVLQRSCQHRSRLVEPDLLYAVSHAPVFVLVSLTRSTTFPKKHTSVGQSLHHCFRQTDLVGTSSGVLSRHSESPASLLEEPG